MPGPLRSSVPCSQLGTFPKHANANFGVTFKLNKYKSLKKIKNNKKKIVKVVLPFTSALHGSGLSSAFLVKFVAMFADSAVKNTRWCLRIYCRTTTAQTTPFKVLIVLIGGDNFFLNSCPVTLREKGSSSALICFHLLITNTFCHRSVLGNSTALKAQDTVKFLTRSHLDMLHKNTSNQFLSLYRTI